MSKINYFYSSLLSLIFCLGMTVLFNSCKADSKEELPETEIEVKESSPAESAEMESNQPATSNGIAEYDGENYDGFLLGQFRYDLAVDALIDEPITDLKGQLINFNKDYTFSVIREGKEIENGQFKYERQTRKLTLLAKKGLSSEWTINYDDGRMIWVGTETYGNNSRQMRLYEVK
jgi:hypothetical protein